tara:strand:+ start:2263 stop:2421 length:159 start_codon:yes stop_codon:yes gene_type:complete
VGKDRKRVLLKFSVKSGDLAPVPKREGLTTLKAWVLMTLTSGVKTQLLFLKE